MIFQQPWIGRKWIEIFFILLPPFASLLFIAIFPGLFRDSDIIPDAWWVVLILLIDVAHVYSTLYRTYFDPGSFKKFRIPLIVIPVTAFIAGVSLYAAGSQLFWRLLAYLAVFHFIRQQYGFLRIYSGKEAPPHLPRYIDHFTIYYATLYPLIYWHLGEPRNFNWFVDNDFVFFRADWLLHAATVLYYITIAVYAIRELLTAIQKKYFNIPRVAILTGTIISWYFGIVYFNGDMAFTLLNVVSHGVPYMALIWIYGEKQHSRPAASSRPLPPASSRLTSAVTSAVNSLSLQAVSSPLPSSFLAKVFSRHGLLLFLGIIFLLAWLEEGLWDMTVWKEHVRLFSIFHLAGHRLQANWLVVVVPLLSLPQVTHYVIDGFIWRRPKT